MDRNTEELINKANKVFLENFPATTCFERAIFLSWYCSKADCKFCYMSIAKDRIKDPMLAKRRKESLLAEAVICKSLGWNIEFLSGGYDCYEFSDIVDIVKDIYDISGQKQWLNLGVLKEKEILAFKPYIQGVCGAIETLNPKLHDKLCPSKPIEPITEMFELCTKLGLKKSMTIIIGLGENIEDFALLEDYIRENSIDRITFYALNPHPGTPFSKSPDLDYYAQWIAKTRISFPKLEIIAGIWKDKADYVSTLLKAGANAITKFPAIRYFGSPQAKMIEEQAVKAERKFLGTLSSADGVVFDVPITDSWLKDATLKKLKNYLKKIGVDEK